MAEWTPKSATPVESSEWMPKSARTPVKAHSRKIATRGQRAVLDFLAPAGATVGGALGGVAGAAAGGVGAIPGGLIGAGVGGAAGQGLRQIASNVMGLETPDPWSLKAMQDIYGEGLTQATLQGAGGAASNIAREGGEIAMQAAIRSTPEVAKRAIKEGVTATTEGLRRALGMVNAPEGGVARLKTVLGRQGQALKATLADAEKKGWQFDRDDFGVRVYNEVQPQVMKQTLNDADLQQLERLRESFENSHPVRMTPQRLQDIKTDAGAILKPIWKAMQDASEGTGPPVGSDQLLRYKYYKGVFDLAQAELERIPGVAGLNANSSELIRVLRATGKAVKGSRNPWIRAAEISAGPAVGGGIAAAVTPGGFKDRSLAFAGGALAGRAAGSPAGMSAAALALNNSALLNVLLGAPRAANYGWKLMQPETTE